MRLSSAVLLLAILFVVCGDCPVLVVGFVLGAIWSQLRQEGS